MQVLCKASNTSSDVRCEICGQGFLMYSWRPSAINMAAARAEVKQALRHHHRTLDTHAAHPPHGFNVPEWAGEPLTFSSAAPTWVAR